MKLERDESLAQWFETLEITKAVFQWDQGNTTKNLKHDVSRKNIESIFAGLFVLGGKVIEPYHIENRWIIFGEDELGRRLALIFTIRDNCIRPISCRPMRREERKIYEEVIQGQSAH